MIAAASAVLLFIFTFLPWLGAEGVDSINLWKSSNSLDIYILLLMLIVVGPALMAATGGGRDLPFAGAAATFLLGVIAVILVFFFLIDPFPSYGVEDGGEGPDTKIGVWLSLLAAIGVAVGGYLALQDESTGPRVTPGAAP